MRNHSNTSRYLRVGWNREGNPKVVSEKKWPEFRSCRSHFFVAKRPHSTQRAREVSWKNWREFRLCKRLFFVMHRLHSTQQMRKLCQKLASIPSMLMTVLHSASATQYTVNSRRGRRHGVSHQITSVDRGAPWNHRDDSLMKNVVWHPAEEKNSVRDCLLWWYSGMPPKI